MRTKDSVMRCNFKRAASDTMGIAGKLSDNADVTAPCRAYWPNELGLYNMAGNVSEWISAEGRNKGGSWIDTKEAMRLDNDGKFGSWKDAYPAIGFRWVMEIIEE